MVVDNKLQEITQGQIVELPAALSEDFVEVKEKKVKPSPVPKPKSVTKSSKSKSKTKD